jgi:D-tyrosyl-tRNA(Tyr) deacylase
VTIADRRVAEIGGGLVILLGVGPQDDEQKAAALARKIALLRIFEDAQGKMNLSVLDVKGAAIVVSQFTLYADTRKGRRPSWSNAAPGPVAEPLVDAFAEALRERGAHVETGRFGAHMSVRLVNDGPVTLILEA